MQAKSIIHRLMLICVNMGSACRARSYPHWVCGELSRSDGDWRYRPGDLSRAGMRAFGLQWELVSGFDPMNKIKLRID
jgi:hypothetical protein